MVAVEHALYDHDSKGKSSEDGVRLMQVSVETVGALGRRLKIAVPAEQLEQAFSDRIRRLSQKVKLPGFRPGKVPTKVVEAHYGAQVMHEVAGDLIQTSFKEALIEHGLKPAGGPQIAHDPLVRGRELEYTAEFEVYPEIPLSNLDGVKIERPVARIVEEDIDRTVENIRRQRRTWNPVPRAAGKGDRVTIDFVGYLNGTPFEGGSATAFPVVLGDGAFIEDLETGLLGIQATEGRKIAVTFPGDYRNATLAGQATEFDVTAKEVAEPVVPEVDEEFVKQLGIADGKLETFRADVRASLEREAASRARGVVRARALNALLERNSFEVPRKLLDSEVERLKRMFSASRPSEEAGAAQLDEVLRQRGSRRVSIGLILAEVVRVRAIQAHAAGVRAKVEELAAEYESPQELIQWHYASPERLADIESQVLEEKAVEELLTTAEISEKEVRFQDLLKMDASTQ